MKKNTKKINKNENSSGKTNKNLKIFGKEIWKLLKKINIY